MTEHYSLVRLVAQDGRLMSLAARGGAADKMLGICGLEGRTLALAT